MSVSDRRIFNELLRRNRDAETKNLVQPCGQYVVHMHDANYFLIAIYDDPLVEPLDGIEGFNARGGWLSNGELNRQAVEFAAENNKPTLGGSDAHLKFEIGNAYTVVEAEKLTWPHIRAAIQAGDCWCEEQESTQFAEPLSQLIRAYKIRSSAVAFRACWGFLEAGVFLIHRASANFLKNHSS